MKETHFSVVRTIQKAPTVAELGLYAQNSHGLLFYCPAV